jgi:ankyrin repeat protein
MCLCSYGADLDVKADVSKMSALHIAVSQKNLEITRFLLCLGADPNQTNSQGDTPRHLAAKLNA